MLLVGRIPSFGRNGTAVIQGPLGSFSNRDKAVVSAGARMPHWPAGLPALGTPLPKTNLAEMPFMLPITCRSLFPSLPAKTGVGPALNMAMFGCVCCQMALLGPYAKIVMKPKALRIFA